MTPSPRLGELPSGEQSAPGAAGRAAGSPMGACAPFRYGALVALILSVALLSGCPHPEVVRGPDHIGQPTISSSELKFEFEGFPALSGDGRYVAVAWVAEDGARGNQNAAIRLIDVDAGHVAHEVVLLSADEYDTLEPVDHPAFLTEIAARQERARALLTGFEWRALRPLAEEVLEPPYASPRRTLHRIGRDLEVRYREPTLEVQREGRVVLRRDVGWGAAQRLPGCQPGDPDCVCENPAQIKEAWVDSTARLLALRVWYSGHDTCWEPDSRLVIVKLQPVSQ